MWNLLKSEVTRFRSLAIGFAVAHFLLLRGISALGDLLAPSATKLIPGLLIYSLSGLLLGLYQLGSYKKIDRWTYLIHRPQEPRSILLAVGGAAAVLLLLVVAVPWWLVVATLDGLTAQWVDARHYLMGFFLLGVSFAFYLVGAFITLSRSRASLLVAGLPMFFLHWNGSGLWIFATQTLVIVALACLVLSVFKPDLSTHVQRPTSVVGNAMAHQLILLMVLGLAGMMAFNVLLITRLHGIKGFAVHTWNDYFQPGTFEHVDYKAGEAREVLAHGLELLEGSHARFLERQIEFAESASIPMRMRRMPPPKRNQLLIADSNTSFVDGEKGIRWTFSHDRMMYHGRYQVSGATAGWQGVQGFISDLAVTRPSEHSFPEIPLALDHQLVTEHQVYQFDAIRNRLGLRFELPRDQRLISPFRDHGSFGSVVSDTHLYLLEPEDPELPLSPLLTIAKVSLPGGSRYLAGIEIAELLDGYLMSFLYGHFEDRGFAPMQQIVVELGPSGAQEILNRRSLTHGHPDQYIYRSFIISPAVQTLTDLIWSAVAPRKWNRVSPTEIFTRPLPSSVIWAALWVAVFCGLSTYWIGARRALATRRRILWTIAVFLTGIPGLLSFLFLTPPRERYSPRAKLPRRSEVMA